MQQRTALCEMFSRCLAFTSVGQLTFLAFREEPRPISQTNYHEYTKYRHEKHLGQSRSENGTKRHLTKALTAELEPGERRSKNDETSAVIPISDKPIATGSR
jgi:hypothetical protein